MTARLIKKTNLRVRFSDNAQVKEIDVVLESDEVDTVWYSRRALREIRQQDDCSNSRHNSHRQKKFISEFLRQQQEHKLMGMDDPKGLFQLSRAFSKQSKQEALRFARDQEQEVKDYISDREQTLAALNEALDILMDTSS